MLTSGNRRQDRDHYKLDTNATERDGSGFVIRILMPQSANSGKTGIIRIWVMMLSVILARQG